MSWILKICVLIGMVIPAALEGQAEPTKTQGEDENPKITIRFFNYAQLPAQTRNDAMDRATAIYRRAGIRIDWVECPVGDQDPSRFPACTEVWDATHLFLHLLPHAPMAITSCGFAPPFSFVLI
jgi:hypothetical protein